MTAHFLVLCAMRVTQILVKKRAIIWGIGVQTNTYCFSTLSHALEKDPIATFKLPLIELIVSLYELQVRARVRGLEGYLRYPVAGAEIRQSFYK